MTARRFRPDSWASDAEPDPEAERYLLVVADLHARLEGWQGERCTLVATDGPEVLSMLAKLPVADAAKAEPAKAEEEPKPAPVLVATVEPAPVKDVTKVVL